MKKLLLAAAACSMAAGTLAQTTDTISRAKATGVVVMGVREAAGVLSYSLGDGKYAGYQVELCQRIIANIEKAVGRKLQVKYLVLEPKSRIPLLQNGTIDMECGASTNTSARYKDVTFTYTTFMEEVRVAVKADSGIQTLAQLNAKNVVTTIGTTSVQLLRKYGRQTGVEFKEVFGKDHADSFRILESGGADALVTYGQIVAGNIATSKNPGAYRIVPEVVSVAPISIMMARDNPALKRIANDTLADLMKSGAIRTLYDKWFMQPTPPKGLRLNLPASETTLAAWANPNDMAEEDYVKK